MGVKRSLSLTVDRDTSPSSFVMYDSTSFSIDRCSISPLRKHAHFTTGKFFLDSHLLANMNPK